MKKVKITVLKTTFDKELAEEYGAKGITACPMLKEGQVFMRTMQNPTAFVMKHRKQFTNMLLRCPTEQAATYFTMATG